MRSPEELTVALEAGATTTALAYAAHPPRVGASLILAHGAGAGQRSSFMVAYAHALAASGVDVVTFNFPYTEKGRRLPDRRPVLEACYVSAIDTVRARARTGDALFIGGKSMGGRIATQVAAAKPALPLAGLVLLGYPLHPPGRPEALRDAHLPDVRRPVLIVQGERDTFGTPAEFEAVLERMTPRPTLHIVPGGDHSFKVARAGQDGRAAVHGGVQGTIAAWVLASLATTRFSIR